MPEKSRAPRKHEVVAISTGSDQQLSNLSSKRLSLSAAASDVPVEEQLAKARQEEKTQKSARMLARDCARAEQEIRRREESLTLIARHGSDVLFRLARDGKFLELSPAGQILLGIDPEALGKRSLQELVAREDCERLRRYLQAVLRGPVAEGILVHLGPRGHSYRALEVYCRAVPQPHTQMLEIVGIARLHPCLESAAKTPDDLACSLAHELNQPLTALAIAARACSQLARAKEVDPEELVQAIDQLAVQAERAGELVRRMRQLAGGRGPRYALVSVQDLTQSAVRMLEADLAREGISVKVHIPGAIPDIKVDRIQMEQVLVNLIRNAIESMSDVPVGQRVLTILASLKDPDVVIVVADTGRGLSPVIAERLFQPYQTTKPHGMGLGLAVSRAILQAHAGRLWVEPAVGPGTTFCLALPLASRES
jgi:PAS domain S-box-containing protein